MSDNLSFGEKKSVSPKNPQSFSFGRILTITSVLLILLAIVISWSGRTRAQSNSSSGTPVVSYPEGNNAPLVQEGVDTISENLSNEAKCEYASYGCYTVTSQTYDMASLNMQLVGDPYAATETTENTTTGGLMSITNKFIADLYQPSVSGTYYVADALNHMGITTEAYAQGYGYYALTPFLSLWRIFRNIAYVFFTVIIIVIGFLILFRQKIGGQAAVTAQQALPRIVVALILVTFSYAIAGFLIDVMYWIMFAFASFTTMDDVNFNNLISGGFNNLVKVMTSGKFTNAYSGIKDLVNITLSGVTGQQWVADLFSGIGAIIGYLIFTIVMITNLFRLLLILLKSYASVLLNVMFAPLTLMLQAVPGVNTFRKWFMSIVANLSPFVVVFFMLIVVGVLNSLGTETANTGLVSTVNAQNGWVPPFISMNSDGAAQSISTLVGLAIMLALPEMVESIKKKLGGDSFFSQMATAAGNNFKKAAPLGTGLALASGGAVIGAAAPYVAGGFRGLAEGAVRARQAPKGEKGSAFRGGLEAGWQSSIGGKGARGKVLLSSVGSGISRGYTGGRAAGGGQWRNAAQSIFRPVDDRWKADQIRYNAMRQKAQSIIRSYPSNADHKPSADETLLRNWMKEYSDFDTWLSKGQESLPVLEDRSAGSYTRRFVNSLKPKTDAASNTRGTSTSAGATGSAASRAANSEVV